MARRAGSGLAAAVALAGLLLPAALVATLGVAQAATVQPVSTPASIAITGMNPQWAAPGSAITVTGVLTNTSKQQLSGLSVQLLGSNTPIGTLSELEPGTTGLAGTDIPGGSWTAPSPLAPGASISWSVRVRASAIGMTTFGVYPVAAQAQLAAVGPLPAVSSTFLPYMPAGSGPYATSRPAPVKIAWVWPLIDTPLLGQPWQSICQGTGAAALAASLSPGGRLSGLVSAGATAAGQTPARTTKAVHGRAATSGAAHPSSAESLARYDGLTWAVDPAVLANVKALATCRASHPRWARAASAWLTQFAAASSGQPVFVTPYADPNVTALIGQGHAGDVSESYALGRSVASGVLNRNVSPSARTGSTALTAGIAWPTDGIAGYSTLENLAATDGIRALLLSSSALPFAPATVMRTLDGAGSYVDVMLSNAALTQLLGSATSAPGSAFATAQQFLAATALLAQQDPGQPIVVTPPRRWQPPGGLPAGLLAGTASAPWLVPSSLASLATAKHIPVVQLPSVGSYQPGFSRHELAQLRNLARQIAGLELLKKYPDPSLYLAVSVLESSAFQDRPRAVTRALLTTLTNRIAAQPKAIQIISESRVTLGGLKGSVPVSIKNGLGYAVQVKLQLQVSQASGIKITQSPPGLVTIGPRTDQTVRVHVQAAQTGSTTITMSLVNRAGQPLPSVTRMTVQATQVGVLGMIIFATALGVFLIASAARAVHRGRSTPPADQAAAQPASSDHGDERSQTPAGADTVVPERTELGTAGKPGP